MSTYRAFLTLNIGLACGDLGAQTWHIRTLSLSHTHTHTHSNYLKHAHTHAHTHVAACLGMGEAREELSAHCNTLQHTATHCNTLQHTTTHGEGMYANMSFTHTHTCTHTHYLRHAHTHRAACLGMREAREVFSRHCNTLQHTATHCNTLQHTRQVCVQMWQRVWARVKRLKPCVSTFTAAPILVSRSRSQVKILKNLLCGDCTV